jgi:hypothetical protein
LLRVPRVGDVGEEGPWHDDVAPHAWCVGPCEAEGQRVSAALAAA